MSWDEFIEFIKDKDCKVSGNMADGLTITCDGKRFIVTVNDALADMRVVESEG